MNGCVSGSIMYEDATTVVRGNGRESNEFGLNASVQPGSVLVQYFSS